VTTNNVDDGFINNTSRPKVTRLPTKRMRQHAVSPVLSVDKVYVGIGWMQTGTQDVEYPVTHGAVYHHGDERGTANLTNVVVSDSLTGDNKLYYL
jgi:hypothetical protein